MEEEFVLGIEGRIFRPGQYQIDSVETRYDSIKSIVFECTVPNFMARRPQGVEVSYGPLIGSIHRQNFYVQGYQLLDDGTVKLSLMSVGEPISDHHEYFDRLTK